MHGPLPNYSRVSLNGFMTPIQGQRNDISISLDIYSAAPLLRSASLRGRSEPTQQTVKKSFKSLQIWTLKVTSFELISEHVSKLRVTQRLFFFTTHDPQRVYLNKNIHTLLAASSENFTGSLQ